MSQEISDFGDATTIKVSCTKMKDSSEFEPLHLRLSPVPLGEDRGGKQITACVLVTVDPPEERGATLRQKDRELLAILQTLRGPRDEKVRTKDWEAKSGLTDFYRHRRVLVEAGLITKENRLTPEGRA